MEATVKKSRECLICSDAINECRLGIDSCRKCAEFYKRILATKRIPVVCSGGDGACVQKGAPTACRKCRYVRFSEILQRANSNEGIEGLYDWKKKSNSDINIAPDTSKYTKSRPAQNADAENNAKICLICSVPISECRLGINCCRACAVFYKRNQPISHTLSECFRGDGMCADKGPPISCRKCRFERFSKVLRKARGSDEDCSNGESALELLERKRTSFIDHTTFCLDEPPCSSTLILLDKIRWSYSLMCHTRKSGESGTKCVDDPSKVVFVPVNSAMVVSHDRIFTSSLYDFANMTFPDFANLATANKELCIASSRQLVSIIEAAYRANHHFPNDLHTSFSSYTSIFNGNSQPAAIQRTLTMNREVYRRVNPDNIEFTALLGLAFWNNEAADKNNVLFAVVEKNRSGIQKELEGVYKSRRVNYSKRLGELVSLLESLENSLRPYGLHATKRTISSRSTRILERIGREYIASVERRRVQEESILAEDDERKCLPHPTERIYLSDHKSSARMANVCAEETLVFFLKAFPSLAGLPVPERDLLFKGFIPKFCLIDALYRTHRVWGELKRFSMDSVLTCNDLEGTAEWLGDEDNWQDQKSLLESLRCYVSMLFANINPIFNQSQITSTEFYAVLALILCEIDTDADEHIGSALDEIRRDVFHELQRYYQVEMRLSDFSRRLGNLMTMHYSIRECISIFQEFLRMHTTMFDLYKAEDGIKALFL